MRIDKFLAHNGYGSRNDAKKLIKAKLVMVNDELVTKATYNVDIESDVVSVDMEEIEYFEKVYYMLNKPAGYICSHESKNYPSVLDLIDTNHKDLIMVGRLDADTEGLLLVTNDGQFSHRVAHGKKEIPKTYYVELEEDFNEDYIEVFEGGIMLDEFLLKPAYTEVLTPRSIHLTISEGRYHQVKRMMHYANNQVTYLNRRKIGHLALDESLAFGEYRDLSEEEIALFD